MCVAKLIKLESTISAVMTREVSDALKGLIVEFVETYSGIVDLELDESQDPKLWFMPLRSYDSKKEAAHYFLQAAALSDYKLTGNPRNIRMLLSHLHETLGNKLFKSKSPEDFKGEIHRFEQKNQLLDKLGDAKAEISEVLCSVNRFVERKANGDLIDYAGKLNRKGLKPKDLAEQLSYSVKRMNKQHKSKCWLYLRWMVRKSPDLSLFPFDPKDLMVPLTTPKFRVYAALGLSEDENLPFKLNVKNRPESWWKNTVEFDADAESMTDFAKSLFPEDPAIIDFPFFILGTWLDYSDLTPVSIEKSMRFFIKKHQEFPKPLIRYLTVIYHYNRIGERIELGAFSALELDIYNFLRGKQAVFDYEFMEFCLPSENATLTYKPDFLLPQLTCNGRKVLLEPHGIKNNLKEELFKLAKFREHYGDFFCLILIVPDDFVETIAKLDPDRKSYDFLWKQSNYKIQFETFHKS
jgi:hypothetical protein